MVGCEPAWTPKPVNSVFLSEESTYPPGSSPHGDLRVNAWQGQRAQRVPVFEVCLVSLARFPPRRSIYSPSGERCRTVS